MAYHDFPFPISLKGVRKALSLMGEELFLLLLKVCTADSMGKNDYARAEYLPKLAEVKEYYKKIMEAGGLRFPEDARGKGKRSDQRGHEARKGDRETACRNVWSRYWNARERNTKEYLLDYAEKIRGEQKKD